MAFYAQKILEKSDEKGMFHFQNFAIDLMYFPSSFIEPTFDGNDIDSFNSAVDVKSIMVHEYQHFFDSTHTVWGVDYLFDLEYAYSHFDDFNRYTREDQFLPLMQIYEKLSSIVLPNYYKLNSYNQTSTFNRNFLKVTPTLGNLFDKYGAISEDKVCFFVNFLQKEIRMLRTPISTIALLEMSAVIEETYSRSFIIRNELEGHELHKRIAENQLKKNLEKLIYNPDLAEYSCLFLLLSNKMKEFNLLDSIYLAKFMVTISLNFTSSHFCELCESEKFQSILKTVLGSSEEGQEFVEKLLVGLKNEDRGVLFLAIYLVLPDDKELKELGECYMIINTILSWIRKNFTYDVLQAEARDYIINTAKSLEKSSVGYIAKVAKAVTYNLDQLDCMKDYFFISQVLPLMDFPPCTMNDMSVIGLHTGDEDKDDPKWNLKFAEVDELEKGINDLSERFLKIERFVEACVA